MKDNETSVENEKNLSKVIKIDEAKIHEHLDTTLFLLALKMKKN